MVSTPNQAMTGQPPDGPAPLPNQPAGSPGNGSMIALTVLSIVFLVASIALLGFAISQRSTSNLGDVVAVGDGAASGPSGGSQEGAGSADEADEKTTPTTTTQRATTTETPPAIEALRPTTIEVTNTRKSVGELACTGGSMSYRAEQLIDRDVQLGWGASADDGAGERATMSFDGPVELTSVGLLPGYAREAPHSKAGCDTVSAFPLNRQIQSVRWIFDDGTSVDQTFEASPEIQTKAVDVTTSSVTMEILSTTRPSRADSDTIISEATFEGRP